MLAAGLVAGRASLRSSHSGHIADYHSSDGLVANRIECSMAMPAEDEVLVILDYVVTLLTALINR
jgi:hypothetical protein